MLLVYERGKTPSDQALWIFVGASDLMIPILGRTHGSVPTPAEVFLLSAFVPEYLGAPMTQSFFISPYSPPAMS
jgi:hypothetical protein